jgi:uncharacterized protein
MPASWLDPRLEIRAPSLHGRGTFAIAPISRGEVVIVWEHRVVTATDLPAELQGEVWPRADGSYVCLPPDDPESAEHFLNHSCEPNVWMMDEVTLVARSDIAAGEELTADYALWELDPNWVAPFRCSCGATTCRGVITGRDWESAELQRQYSGHFHPMLVARIAERDHTRAATGDV